MKEKEAADKLSQIDKEQKQFFKKAFDKKDAVPYEFDMVINFDYIKNTKDANGQLLKVAFKKKFAKNHNLRQTEKQNFFSPNDNNKKARKR